MTGYVLDASVAAKWYLPRGREAYGEEALELLRGYAKGSVRLLVPELFWCETGNIFWKAARTGRMQPASASAAVENLAALGIPSAPCQALLPDAFALATAFDRTVYDCVYIALAMRTGRKLVTADERLAAATATRLPVLWLGALGYAG